MNQLLIFAPAADAHARAVIDALRPDCRWSQIDLSVAAAGALEVHPGDVVVLNGKSVADPGTTVWWRRTGRVAAVAGMSAGETRLRADETFALVLGGLLSLKPRWVDEPGRVQVAEHTLLQLAVADACGARRPLSLATNIPATAHDFAERGEVLAKATSSGRGIAPFADRISAEALDLVSGAPTLLQEVVAAVADLRVVIVGNDAFVWRRARNAAEPVDWRNADPRGAGFVLVHAGFGLNRMAVAITRGLGLAFSVQDWLETPDGPVFLEANPVGQWLFLAGAENSVAPSLAAHLTTGTR